MKIRNQYIDADCKYKYFLLNIKNFFYLENQNQNTIQYLHQKEILNL